MKAVPQPWEENPGGTDGRRIPPTDASMSFSVSKIRFSIASMMIIFFAQKYNFCVWEFYRLDQFELPFEPTIRIKVKNAEISSRSNNHLGK